jgi:hypothetical protein
MRPLRAALAALLIALAAFPASAGAAEAVHYTSETYPQFEAQLGGHQIAAVTFNKRLRSMRVTLKNGEHVLVIYPKHTSSAQIAKVQAQHVPVTVLSVQQAQKEAPKHGNSHPRRRDAEIAGVVILVLAAIGGGVYFFKRRRVRD